MAGVAEEGVPPSVEERSAEARARLDPTRPLRMPGASLRESDPSSIYLVGRLLGVLRSRLGRPSPKPDIPPASDVAATDSAASSSTPAAPASAPERATEVASETATEGADASATSKPKAKTSPLGYKLAIGGLLAFAGVMIAIPFVGESEAPAPTATATSAVETTQAAQPSVAAAAPADAGVAVDAAPPPAPPKVFRVRSLAEDPELEIVEGTVGKRPLLSALTASGLPMRDAFRAIHSFKGKTFDHPKSGDAFVYARRRQGGRLVAFEYIVPPFDVWQAREGTDGKLEGKKVEFVPEERRVARSIVVGDDLRKSLAQAELDDDLLGMLDDALDGHAELVDMRPGARLRVVVVEERIEGTFARYSELDAVEYSPANAKAKTVRVYRYDPDGRGQKRKAHVYYDGERRQPYKGGFRSPLPLGRVTSRFNPRRMHPVLHVIMPHNGVDFAAPVGTPIYATASGVVRVSSYSGPNGNMVQVEHPNGLVSAYCHLSRFAAGLHPGQHVEARQLVGYVGQTGRSTGPHLHFAIKRGDVFLDPLSLRLDGVRTLPPSEHEAFDKVKGELDQALDSVALPPPPAGTEAAEAEDVIYDEVAGDGGAGDAAP